MRKMFILLIAILAIGFTGCGGGAGGGGEYPYIPPVTPTTKTLTVKVDNYSGKKMDIQLNRDRNSWTDNLNYIYKRINGIPFFGEDDYSGPYEIKTTFEMATNYLGNEIISPSKVCFSARESGKWGEPSGLTITIDSFEDKIVYCEIDSESQLIDVTP